VLLLRKWKIFITSSIRQELQVSPCQTDD